MTGTCGLQDELIEDGAIGSCGQSGGSETLAERRLWGFRRCRPGHCPRLLADPRDVQGRGGAAALSTGVRQCTRTPSRRPAGRVGCSPSARVRLTLAGGGGPLAEPVSSCPKWGTRSTAIISRRPSRAPMQQRDAARVVARPGSRSQLVGHDPRRRAYFADRLLRESRIDREAPSDPLGQRGRRRPCPHCRGDRRLRGPASADRLQPCRVEADAI